MIEKVRKSQRELTRAIMDRSRSKIRRAAVQEPENLAAELIRVRDELARVERSLRETSLHLERARAALREIQAGSFDQWAEGRAESGLRESQEN